MAHFINCHGGRGSNQFFGQAVDQGPMTAALDSAQLKGHVKEGTVVASECCYGADLYNPAVFGTTMGICNAYLAESAFGFFGSSTIAYGPPTGNDFADLICLFFLKRIREGSSLGRACLQARLDYTRSLNGKITPTSLKTLAQFGLLGDPSLVPVESTTAPTIVKAAIKPKSMPKGLSLAAATSFTQFAADRSEREDRRDWLRNYSNLLASTASCATAALDDHDLGAVAKGGSIPSRASAADRGVGQQLQAMCAEMGLKSASVQVFGMASTAATIVAKGVAAGAKAITKSAPAATADRVHLVIERTEQTHTGESSEKKTVRVKGFEAVESDGILQIKKFVSR